MARPGLGPERIIEVIRELEAVGREVTVTAVRERLGSGSFSTIGTVVADWRREKASGARPAIPEPPEGVRAAYSHLWAEAWKAAMAVHEPERQAFATERQERERARAEMTSEIARLENELDAEKERAGNAFRNLEEEFQSVNHERDAFRDEVQEVRTALAAAEGALQEARKQVEREAERSARTEERVAELSERLIAEAAKAQALAARIKEP